MLQRNVIVAVIIDLRSANKGTGMNQRGMNFGSMLEKARIRAGVS